MNGALQNAYIQKDDAASTVMTDSVFLAGAIDAYERMETVGYDVPVHSCTLSWTKR